MIHPTAIVDGTVDPTSKVWAWAHIREGARVAHGCIVGEHVYIDHDVVIGSGCKIQNGANLYAPLVIGSNVFIGPGAIICNDRAPRAWMWDPTSSLRTVICDRASVGAGAIILPGVTIGESAIVGAGSVVVHDVPPNVTVFGSPARGGHI
jgi:acetyltransferase-like isoleucine patch superfamily enzyme